jgi:hypothetical protein
MGRSRRGRKPPRRRREPGVPSHNELNRDTRASKQRSKMLDLSKESIFRYDMEDILEEAETPGERIPSTIASIWSKASRQGVDEAKDFIRVKREEGLYDQKTEERILRLLQMHTRYR